MLGTTNIKLFNACTITREHTAVLNKRVQQLAPFVSSALIVMSKDVIFIAVPAGKRVYLHLRHAGKVANAAVPVATLNGLQVE